MKTCISCLQSMTDDSFPTNSKGGTKANCRKCYAAYARALHRKHHPPKPPPTPEEITAKHAIRNAKRNAWLHKKWGTKPLNLYQQEQHSIRLLRLSQKTQVDSEKIKLFAEYLRSNYGDPLANLYLVKPWVPNSTNADLTPKLQKLKAEIICQISGLKSISWSIFQRIIHLNKACRLPLLNVGWHCASCGLFHSNPTFFDLDHIIPKVHHGPNSHSNIQCLCPNCHRKKTKGIDGVQLDRSFAKTSTQLCAL